MEKREGNKYVLTFRRCFVTETLDFGVVVDLDVFVDVSCSTAVHKEVDQHIQTDKPHNHLKQVKVAVPSSSVGMGGGGGGGRLI